MTSPIQEELWSESRLVSVSNGAAYECIRTYLLDNYQKKFAVYQPVSVNAYAPTTEDHVGEASIPFLDSYKFTFDLLQELVRKIFFDFLDMCVLCSITIDWSTDVYSSVLLLQANYGVQLDAFLGVERTGWSYLAETDESPQPPSPQNSNANGASIVHQGSVFSSASGDGAILPSITELKWGEGDPVPTNVTEWWGPFNISFIYRSVADIFVLYLVQVCRSGRLLSSIIRIWNGRIVYFKFSQFLVSWKYSFHSQWCLSHEDARGHVWTLLCCNL